MHSARRINNAPQAQFMRRQRQISRAGHRFLARIRPRSARSVATYLPSRRRRHRFRTSEIENRLQVRSDFFSARRAEFYPCKHGLADLQGPPLRRRGFSFFVTFNIRRSRIFHPRYARLFTASRRDAAKPAPALRSTWLFYLVTFNIRRSRIFHSAPSAEYNTCEASI